MPGSGSSAFLRKDPFDTGLPFPRASEARRVAISKALSTLLRHTGPQHSVFVADDGYADLEEVLASIPMQVTLPSRDELIDIVRNNNKDRFKIEERRGRLLIRANQGHSLQSVNTELVAQRISLADMPPVIVHGTSAAYSESIRTHGLMAGGWHHTRNDVHFALGLQGDARVKSGMRRNCDLFVYLDGQKAFARGLELFRSSNDVVISAGFNGHIPPYLLWATDARGNELWRFGVKDSDSLNLLFGGVSVCLNVLIN